MSLTTANPQTPVAAKRKDGVIGLWGRIIHRQPDAYESWLEERDMTIITAALLRLNERQLNRIGMSRTTLALDLEDLAMRAERDAQIASEVLRLVENEPNDTRSHAIAAE